MAILGKCRDQESTVTKEGEMIRDGHFHGVVVIVIIGEVYIVLFAKMGRKCELLRWKLG